MLGYETETKIRYVMNNVDNKDLLFAAIDNYDLVSENQKKILKIFIDFDDKVSANVIMQTSGMSKQVVYPILNKLIKMELITKNKNITPAVFTFQINKTKIYEILDFFVKKQSIAIKYTQ